MARYFAHNFASTSLPVAVAVVVAACAVADVAPTLVAGSPTS